MSPPKRMAWLVFVVIVVAYQWEVPGSSHRRAPTGRHGARASSAAWRQRAVGASDTAPDAGLIANVAHLEQCLLRA